MNAILNNNLNRSLLCIFMVAVLSMDCFYYLFLIFIINVSCFIFRNKVCESEPVTFIQNVQVNAKSNHSIYSKKRSRDSNQLSGILKKPKLLDVEKVDKSTPCKKMIDYSIIQEMVSTPKVKHNTPQRNSPTPGPPSILRVSFITSL